MSKIAVDIDDTLYSFGRVAKDALFHLARERDDKDILNAAYTESLQWRTPNDVAGNEVWMEAIELAHQPEVILQQPAYPGAAQTLRALVDAGHELIYVSNRSEAVTEATNQWLEDNDFPNPKAKCLWGDKMPHLRQCQYIIDDRASTLIRFVNDFEYSYRGLRLAIPRLRLGFGLHYAHNTNLTDAPNIYLAPSWAGLNYFFVKKGLLDEPAYEPFAPTTLGVHNGRTNGN